MCGAGALVPHPSARSSRVFAPAPPDAVAAVAASGVNVDANADDSNADDSRVPREGALLEDASALFAGATAAGAWELADAIATFLLAAAAAAPALDGRDAFVRVARDGGLTRALGGGKGGGGGGGEATAAAAAAAAVAAAAALTGTGPAASIRLPESSPSPAPASIRLAALGVVRLLAAVPAFLEFLDASESADDATTRVDATATATATATVADRSTGDRPFEGCPLLRALVACLEDAAEEEEEDDVSERRATSDAALLALAALSHAGWSGWGAAVRRHGVLAAAVVAAEASFGNAFSSTRRAKKSRFEETPGFEPARAAAIDDRRVKHALMFAARLLAEPGSAAVAMSALRRDGETSRRLAKIARAAQAHADAMPRRVGKYFATVLDARPVA